jgi:hypothetical protein
MASVAEVQAGVEEARQLLLKRFIRCAEAGKLNTTPDEAAQTLIADCVGVSLCLLSQPDTFSDPRLSRRVRDAVLRGLLVGAAGPAADQQTEVLKSVALQLASQALRPLGTFARFLVDRMTRAR